MSRAEILQRKADKGEKISTLPLKQLFITPEIDEDLEQPQE